jgi:sugar lactone lactonase YvrE
MRLTALLVALTCIATVSASAAAPPRVRAVDVPRQAQVGAAWRGVVSLSRPAAGTLEARGPSTVSAKLTRVRKTARYTATLRFPSVGSWTLSAVVGGRRTGLGAIAVDVARDPLLVDPFTIAVERAGTLLVGNLRQGSLVRLGAGGRATTVAARSVGHLTISPQGQVLALSDQALYRLDGGSLARIAGDGVFRFAGDGGPALAASFDGTTGAAVDAAGNIYVGEYEGRIRRIAPDGTITTLAGTGDEGYAGDGGPARQATLNRPHGLAIGRDGALYVADTLNNRIRRIDLQSGVITTFATDVGVVVSLAFGVDGTLYAADVGGGVTATSPSGSVTRIFSGNATNVAVAPDGTLYVVGNETKRIFALDPASRRTATVARG